MASIEIIKAHILSHANEKDYGVLPASASSSESRAKVISELLDKYWSTIKGNDINSQNVANLLLEWCFVIGNPRTAIALTQKFVKVPADSLMTIVTLRKLNIPATKALFVAYHEYRKKWYQERAADASLRASCARSMNILDTIKCNVLIFGDGVKFNFSDTPTTAEINLAKSYCTKYLQGTASPVRRPVNASRPTSRRPTTSTVTRPTTGTVTRPATTTTNTVSRPTSNTVTRPATTNTVSRPTSKTATRPTTNSSAGSRPASATVSASTLNYDLWAPFFISFVGGFSLGNTENPLNKGVRLSIWKSCGRDLNNDGKIDVEDLKLITDADAIAATKKNWWDKYHLDQLKSQNVANAILDWLWFTGSSALTKICKAIGETVTVNNFIEEANKQTGSTLFSTINRARKAAWEEQIKNDPSKQSSWDGWMRRLNSIQYNQLTTKEGRKISFTDEGFLINDGTSPEPKYGIWEAFYHSYNEEETVHNKGLSLSDWTRWGSDLNKDGNTDERDLMMLTDAKADLCRRLWFSWGVDLYKSQNLANFFADWTMQDGTTVSFQNLGKHFGTRSNMFNIVAESNKRDSKTLFAEFMKLRKDYYNELIAKEPQKKEELERKLKRLEGLEYGKVTCADGRVITFNDDGTIVSDISPVKPKIDILAPYIFSYEDGYFDDGNGHITCFGITLEQWKRYGCDLDGDKDVDEKDLEQMTTEEGIAVLKRCYWDVAKADKIHSQNVANIVVDAVWRIGNIAIRLVKEKLGLKADTMMDTATLQAINSRNPEELFYDLFDMLSEYYDTHAENNPKLDYWWMKFDGLQYGELTCNNGRRITFKDDGTVTGDEIVPIETDDIFGDENDTEDETQPATDATDQSNDDIFDEGSGWDSSEWDFSDFDMDNLLNTEQ